MEQREAGKEQEENRASVKERKLKRVSIFKIRGLKYSYVMEEFIHGGDYMYMKR